MVTVSTTDFGQKIQHFVNGVHDVTDLHSLLQHIPLEAIKQFVINEITKFSSSTSKSAFYNAISIDEILPREIIQTILSFNIYESLPQCVSKSWNKIAYQNLGLKLRGMYKHAEFDIVRNKYVTFDANKNQSIIVHPNRTKPHVVEEKIGFIGPMALQQARVVYQDGDRLLLHNGVHAIPESDFENADSIQFIGVGSHVQLDMQYYWEDYSSCREEIHFVGNKVYCENISFSQPVHVENQKVVFNNCIFSKDSFVNVYLDGSVVCDSCRFQNCRKPSIVSQKIARYVGVVNSQFLGVDVASRSSQFVGAILIDESEDESEVVSGAQCKVQLECFGNAFMNCVPPFVENLRDETDRQRLSNQCELQDNIAACTKLILQGNSTANDSNKLHHSNGTFFFYR